LLKKNTKREKLLADDLIQTATDLASKPGKPKQSDLRRAASTTYYALFHCIARCCADLMIGTGGADRSPEAWNQVYRSLDHTAAKKACQNQQKIGLFPTAIQDFANMFTNMQEKRHLADYSPTETFYRSAVKQDILDATDVMRRFKAAPIKDRRAFAAFVLFKQR
jgi:uncharacterized protein (UPF0332 family)